MRDPAATSSRSGDEFAAVHDVTGEPRPRRITILIPNSSGDIAINAGVTRYLKHAFPGVAISLVTHPRFTPAGAFNPDYDEVIGYGQPYAATPPWLLPYRNQVAAAQQATPTMDRLYLPQPLTWRPELFERMSVLKVQQELCGVPVEPPQRPRLKVPGSSSERIAEWREGFEGRAVFLAPDTNTISLGTASDLYWTGLLRRLSQLDVWIFWNSRKPHVPLPRCVAVGNWALADAVALAVGSDGVISSRSGLSDIIGFCGPDIPHRVLYSAWRNPYFTLSWLELCSLREMGVAGACECVTSLDTAEDAEREIDQTLDWLRRCL